MSTEDTPRSRISRRDALIGLGGVVAGGAAVELIRPHDTEAAPGAASTALWLRPGNVDVADVHGVHLQFGADPSTEMVVSWATPASVSAPRVLFGLPSQGYGRTVGAEVVTYTDAKSKTEVVIHHTRLTGLQPDTEYIYAAVHDGAQPMPGVFRTAPRGRRPFTFTSFGDQGTPTLGRKAGALWVNDNLGSPAAGDVVSGVERIAPLLHLINGDLCYAGLATDRVRSWSDWFLSNSRSARFRPWMPTAGNHENEFGNGPIGYAAYQSYFRLPSTDTTPETAGLWYAFTVGSVRFVFVQNDDVCYQDAGSSYVHGYSSGRQKAWLKAELSATRADRDIDWIVVVMHETVISTAETFNGADRGVREEWVPLFDAYGVDLVVCGHEHHYERSYPVRGQESNDTLTPIPVSDDQALADTSAGTVHMVIGGGGTSAPSNGILFDTPACRVITGTTAKLTADGRRTPIYVQEDAPWSANRDQLHPYGFAAFTVDPGSAPGDTTTIDVVYYAITGPYGALTPVDKFTLTRPRRDG